MNNEIKEILEIFKQVDLEQDVGGCYNCPKKDKDKTCIGCLNNAKDKLLDYITNLQQENERLKETNVYCNRTDCVGRIKDSKKYDSVYQEKEDYKSRIEKAVEELELWKPKNKVIQLEIELLLNILRGEDK